MSSQSSSKDRYHHGDLPRTLVAAAVELIHESGVESLTIRAVARRVGVSHAAPAHHFGDRAGLLAAVAEAGFTELVARMEKAALKHDASPLDALRAIAHAYAVFAKAHPDELRVMFHAVLADKSPWPILQQVSLRALEVVTTSIERCRDAGLIRRVEPRTAALTVWAALHGLSLLLVDGQLAAKGYASPLSVIVDGVLDDLFLGLRA